MKSFKYLGSTISNDPDRSPRCMDKNWKEEMRCYQRLLDITYTNEHIHNKIQDVIGKHDDSLNIVMKRNLRWYGHISRASGMVKTILQGTAKEQEGMEDRERRGKQYYGLDKAGYWHFEDRLGWRRIVKVI